MKVIKHKNKWYLQSETGYKEILLSTDADLIKDGVQAIDDDFLEWFVENPSCENVEVEKDTYEEISGDNFLKKVNYYATIIPKEEPTQLFTDYPIIELGDNEFVEAPIRECKLISYDNNKYCYVKVEGIEKEIKRCYIYPQKGRCGKVDCISFDEIKELLKEEPKQILGEIHKGKINMVVGKPKQETLEEIKPKDIQRIISSTDAQTASIEIFKLFAKWQQEQDKKMYSEEEMFKLTDDYEYCILKTNQRYISFKEWFKKFKKK